MPESPAQVLVVANRTAATPALTTAVRERAARGPTEFTLLVPYIEDRGSSTGTVNTLEAEATLELALPLLEDAAGGVVEGVIGDSDPLAAIQTILESRAFDEIILSTLPEPVSRWLRIDVPHKVKALGLPLTTVTARARLNRAEIEEHERLRAGE